MVKQTVFVLAAVLHFYGVDGDLRAQKKELSGPHAQVKLVMHFQDTETDSLIRKIPDGMSFQRFLEEMMISDSLLTRATEETGSNYSEKMKQEIRENLEAKLFPENGIVQINFFHKDKAYALRFLDEFSNSLMVNLMEYRLSLVNRKLWDIEKELEAMKKTIEEPGFGFDAIFNYFMTDATIPELKARAKILSIIRESCLTTIRFIEEENDAEWDDFLPTAYYEDEALRDEVEKYKSAGLVFYAPRVAGDEPDKDEEKKTFGTPPAEREKLKNQILTKLKDRLVWVDKEIVKNRLEQEEALNKIPEEERKKIILFIGFTERGEVLYEEKNRLEAIKNKVVKPIKTIEGTVYSEK